MSDRINGFILVHNPPQWEYPVSSTTLWPAIQYFGEVHFNHVAIDCTVDGERMILEAVGPGVVLSHYLVWEGRAVRELLEIPFERDLAGLLVHVGKKYDLKSLLFFCAVKRITQGWGLGPEGAGVWLGPTDEERFYCYELAGLAAGMEKFWSVMPREFLVFLAGTSQANAQRLARYLTAEELETARQRRTA